MIAMKYYTSTTQFNCGIDLHARQMYVCVMDRQGQKLVHTNIKNNDFDFFLKLVAPWRHGLSVCCECMFGWYWLADAWPSGCRATRCDTVSPRICSNGARTFARFRICLATKTSPRPMIYTHVLQQGGLDG
jgi:hypothetical protein